MYFFKRPAIFWAIFADTLGALMYPRVKFRSIQTKLRVNVSLKLDSKSNIE
jgi:hypothetical protein